MMKDIGYEMNTYHESKEDIEYDKYIVDFKKLLILIKNYLNILEK